MTHKIFDEVQLAHLVTSGPRLRTIHPIVYKQSVYFHSSPRGEKLSWVGQEVLLCAEQVVARVPSYFRHPERACPATTLYRSAQLSGVLERVDDLEEKAAVLQQLMRTYQPEGGYREISTTDPIYTGVLKRLSVFRIDGQLSVKEKLGQKKSDPERWRMMAGLWERGDRGDDAAIEAMVRAKPEGELPKLLKGPHGTRLSTRVPQADIGQALALVREEYWNTSHSDATLREAHLRSPIWVGAYVGDRLIATARAVSDGAKYSFVMDVAVHPAHRGRGIGRALLELLFDHPLARRSALVQLVSKDPEFYERLGLERATLRPGRTLLQKR